MVAINNKLITIGLSFIFLYLVGARAYAEKPYSATIYNNTNQNWTVNFIFPNDNDDWGGGLDSQSECVENVPCLIFPHRQKRIFYTNHDKWFKGTVTIIDDHELAKSFGITTYYWSSWLFGPLQPVIRYLSPYKFSDTPWIEDENKAATSAIALNEPSAGEITIKGDYW
jgi:hypothetical protein